MKRLALLAVLLALAPPATAGPSFSLVVLPAGTECIAAARLAAAGGVLVAPELRVWRVPAAAARLAPPGSLVEPDRALGTLETPTDPLFGEQWWRAAVGADRAEPPGPGIPVTVVDSGVDLSGPEFAGRPDTIALNEQAPTGKDGAHGTAVASLIAAPANGTGVVGIYPQAVLQTYDAAPRGQLLTSEIVAGIEAAAERSRGVINLSLGSRDRDPVLERAVYFAVARGSLVVAASGNERETGSPAEYPSALPHVLSVGATVPGDEVAPFSNASPALDLVAPGQDLPVAVPEGFSRATGTSFAAPLVSGAAAWVWTMRPELDASQLFEVMRRSARDLGPPGFDVDTGFGTLDVAAALAFPAPPRDPGEPNDDLDLVRPTGFFENGAQPLTSRTKPRSSLVARLDAREDRHDVYPVYLAPRKAVTVIVRPVAADVDVFAWRRDALTVLGADAIAESAHARPGEERLVLRNTSRAGTTVYVDVTLGARTPAATYGLTVRTGPLRARR